MKQTMVWTFLMACLAMISMAQSATKDEKPMTQRTPESSAVPPDVARYLQGATAQGLQFDFLIGTWDVNGRRYKPDGGLLLEYKARWVANYLHGKRMIMDDFTTYSPSGQEVSSFVTLRTYSEATGRWEIVGLSALQPSMTDEWFGAMRDGEMQLDASGKTPDGKRFRNRIRFFEISRDSFKWESRVSIDDGSTWLLTASLIAARVPG